MPEIYTKRKLIILISLVVVSLVFIVILGGSLFFSKSKNQKVKAMVGSKIIQVEIASTTKDQIKGLSGRKFLEEDSGMLFDFNDYQVRTFWMKDMNFPIDIIWISEGKIVGVDKNLPPEGNNPQKKYYSPGPVNRVLEMNAGWFDRNEIMVGQAFSLIDVDKNF